MERPAIAEAPHTPEVDPDAVPERGRTLTGLPRPGATPIFAALTVLACGLGLGYVGGWASGVPPYRSNPEVVQEAYRYNSTNVEAPGEVLLLGDSLMELGVIEEDLADLLGPPRPRVINLGVPGAKAWDVDHLVHLLDPPRTRGPKVAVLQLDRAWFDASQSPRTRYAESRLREISSAGAPASPWERAWRPLADLLPDRREAYEWASQIRYGFLGERLPGLVRVPSAPRRELWDMDPEAQRHALAAVDRIARYTARMDTLAEHSIEAVRLTVQALKGKGYRVVLLLSPLQSDVLAKFAARPASAALERQYQDRVLGPGRFGVTDIVVFPDAASLGVDDSIFIDYGHMNRDGARAQTRKLAEALRAMGAFTPGR